MTKIVIIILIAIGVLITMVMYSIAVAAGRASREEERYWDSQHFDDNK